MDLLKRYLAVLPLLAVPCLVTLMVSGCGIRKKLAGLSEENGQVRLELPAILPAPPEEYIVEDLTDSTGRNEDGGPIIMNAIRNEDGEMTAHDVIPAAVVSARFRNVAERHGTIALEFQIIVPSPLQDSRWQLRFTPQLAACGDTSDLDEVFITGDRYRKAQLRGYQHYERYIRSIITDTSRFVNRWQLELYLQRNIPELYRFRKDTTRISEEDFSSIFGVTEQEAVRHYTDHLAERRNRKKMERKDEMFRKYVKAPIEDEGLVLDTVIQNPEGDFIYNYIHRMKVLPGMKKADILLSGRVFEEDRAVWTVPRTDPLTFYISSLETLADNRERFLFKVVERKAEANTACYIDFASGKSSIDEDLGYNREEIGRIKNNLRNLINDDIFDMDSIIIRASASPEGAADYNIHLSERRAEAISNHFRSWMEKLRDSIRNGEGFRIDLKEADTRNEGGIHSVEHQEIKFSSRSEGENWTMLDRLVLKDTVMTDRQKKEYTAIRQIRNADSRERKMQGKEWYPYMRSILYPRLRTVLFDFHLHRKGMIKDTVHTTEPDLRYREGLQAIHEKRYTDALELLKDYSDYNTAVVYLSLDKNASALEILEKLPQSAGVCYMQAIIWSRYATESGKGGECSSGRSGQRSPEARKALQFFEKACNLDPMFRHRGNLDPEIYRLTQGRLMHQQ